MIIGIGTDLIEIERIKKACQNNAFLIRYFTYEEQQLIGANFTTAAGNFAVKEAVVKVFGTGFRKIGPKDIEVLRDSLGKPYINLYGYAEELSRMLHVDMLHVSITNTKDYASAYVIGESR